MKHLGNFYLSASNIFPPKYSLLDYCYPNFTLRRQGGGKEYNDLRTHMPHKPQLLHRCPHFQLFTNTVKLHF